MSAQARTASSRRSPRVPQDCRRWLQRRRPDADAARRGGRRAAAAMVREGQTGSHRLLFVSDPLHLQDPAGRWPRRCCRRSRRSRGELRRRCARRSQLRQAGAMPACAGQWGHDQRPDEGEVRRDHDARLPAVHQGHVPRRDAHGSLLGALRRRHRRQHVRRPHVRSVDGVGQEVARRARDEDGGDRRQVPAHLEQRADQPRRSR